MNASVGAAYAGQGRTQQLQSPGIVADHARFMEVSSGFSVLYVFYAVKNLARCLTRRLTPMDRCVLIEICYDARLYRSAGHAHCRRLACRSYTEERPHASQGNDPYP